MEIFLRSQNFKYVLGLVLPDISNIFCKQLMLGPSLRIKKNESTPPPPPRGFLWVQIYTSTLALYGGLWIRIPFHNMLLMARLEVQFDNPDNN